MIGRFGERVPSGPIFFHFHAVCGKMGCLAEIFDTVLKFEFERFKNVDANIPIYFMKTIEIMQTFQLCLFLE